MISRDLILHRANSPVNMPSPLEQVDYYVRDGYNKLEIDIYAVAENVYKFCHPLDREKVTETHDLNDTFLAELVAKYPDVEWMVDLKCLDLDKVPMDMVRHLVDTFNETAIFTAAQREILEYAHENGKRTALYFKKSVDSQLNYEPDFYMHLATQELNYPTEKTIVFCLSLEEAEKYLGDNHAGVMADGHWTINSQE